MTTPILPTFQLQQNPDIMAAALGDETVMMSLTRNNYYGLDEVGSRIWKLLAQPHSVADLSATLVQEFDVDVETCQHEVAAFVQQLVDEGLIQVG